MKNNFHFFKNTYVLKITGKNPKNFIRKIALENIEILKLNVVDRHTLILRVYKKDYEEILRMKSIYTVDIIDVGGHLKIKKKMKSYHIFFLSFLFGFLLLYLLSLLIFKVEIVHTNKEIRNLLYEEFDQYGLQKYHFRKSYQDLQKIKEKIVYENREKIEWLEIERVGTKYVVRVEIRKKEKKKEEKRQVDVVSKKSAVIRKIDAKSGEIIKSVGEYVTKGEIIISGAISLNDEVKGYLPASGKVYGEVWYKVHITYPYKRNESYTTGKEKEVYTLRFLKHRIEFFNSNPYKNKDIKAKVLWKHPFLPISFAKENQKEKKIIQKTYKKEEAIKEAEKLSKTKIEKRLKKNEYIIDQKKLKVTQKNSKIVVDIFYTVYEDITDTKETEIIVEKEE